MIAFNLFSKDMRAEADKDNARVLRIYARRKPTRLAAPPFSSRRRAVAEGESRAGRGTKRLQSKPSRARAAKTAAGVTEEKLVGYKYDTAFGFLISRVLPEGTGWQGFVLAALLGAVVSSLAAMLNAASTIFSLDLYRAYVAPARLAIASREAGADHAWACSWWWAACWRPSWAIPKSATASSPSSRKARPTFTPASWRCFSSASSSGARRR